MRSALAPVDEDGGAYAAEVVGPLGPWALAAIAGAAAGERLALAGLTSGWLWAAAVVGALLGVVAASRPDAAGPGPGLGGLALLAVALVLAGTAGVRVAALDDGLLPQLAARGGQAVVSVVVAQEPRPTAQGWHLDVRALAVDGEATREGAAIRLDADTTPPGLGERWEVLTTARPPPDDGYGRWLARRHARVLLDPVRIEHAGEAGPLARSSEHVRARIRTAATARTPDDVGGLLVGLVTGDTRLLSDGAQQAMRDTSLTHLTAVSGTHVAVLVAGVLGLCTLLRLGAVGRRRAVAISLLGFAYLTRFEPSVLRAGTMAAVLLLAFARGVPRDARHALAGAVLLLVLVDPLLASTLGLLLSATATAGVLVIAPRVSERLARMRRIPSRVGDLLGVTVGAQVAVLPLLLATFGEVPLASVPANLLAVPPGAAAAGLGFLAAALSVVHTGAGEVLFLVAGVPARLVLLASRAARRARRRRGGRPAAGRGRARVRRCLAVHPGRRQDGPRHRRRGRRRRHRRRGGPAAATCAGDHARGHRHRRRPGRRLPGGVAGRPCPRRRRRGRHRRTLAAPQRARPDRPRHRHPPAPRPRGRHGRRAAGRRRGTGLVPTDAQRPRRRRRPARGGGCGWHRGPRTGGRRARPRRRPPPRGALAAPGAALPLLRQRAQRQLDRGPGRGGPTGGCCSPATSSTPPSATCSSIPSGSAPRRSPCPTTAPPPARRRSCGPWAPGSASSAWDRTTGTGTPTPTSWRSWPPRA
jgi:ComEC/Rec2-related protein